MKTNDAFTSLERCEITEGKVAFLMYNVATFSLQVAFVHVCFLFAFVYLVIIKGRPLRGSTSPTPARRVAESRAFSPCLSQWLLDRKALQVKCSKTPTCCCNYAWDVHVKDTAWLSVALRVFDFSLIQKSNQSAVMFPNNSLALQHLFTSFQIIYSETEHIPLQYPIIQKDFVLQ